jgi:TonB-dependent starch-binding outer membrane protein SusC
MKFYLKISLVLGWFLSPLWVFSQTKNGSTAPEIQSVLHGTIVDSATKYPVQGATVQIAGTTHAVATNGAGRFEFITGQRLPLILEVSYVGYKSLRLEIDKNDAVIALTENQSRLNDVVVVGYGTQKRKDVVGSISVVKTGEIKSIPGGSFDQQLQGMAAGVQVNAGSGIPGQDLFIRVRGTTSIYASNDPLYIIDGVFINSATLEQTTSITASGRNTTPIADINPSDIESIEILKDATAVAIYGSRGANGVVIVTTKKGDYGQRPTLDLNVNSGASWVPKKREWKTTTGPQHATLINEYDANMGKPLDFRPVDSVVNGAAGLGTPDEQKTYDRMKYLDHQGAPLYNINLAVHGGSKDSKYYIGGGYTREDAIWNPIAFSRASLKFNLDQKLGDRVSISTYNTLSVTPRNQANAGNGANGTLLESSLNIPTYLPIFSSTGVPLKWVNFDNITYLTDHVNIKSVSLHYIGNVAINVDLLSTLKFRSSWGVDYDDFDLKQYWGSNTNIGAAPNINGYAQESNTKSTTFVNEQTLQYSNSLGKHRFGVLVGNTLQQATLADLTASGYNFPNNSYTLISQAASQTAAQSWTQNRLTSFFSRVNYNYASKYYLEATLRGDGSSKFAPGHQWGYFPSIGASWNARSESFLENATALSDLRFRVSYGITGNQGGIGDFAAQGLWNSGVGYVNSSGVQQPGTGPYQLPNPNLTWEQTAQTNVGTNIGLFKNAVNIELNYYNKYTTNLLVQAQAAATTGFSTYYTNDGAIRNRGFEFAVTSVNFASKDFRWTTEFNASRNFNRIVQLSSPITNFDANRNLLIDKQGYALYSYWLYKQAYVDPKTGAAVFKHADGTTGTAYTTSTNTANRQIFDIAPRLFGGLTNGFVYKAFDLNVFFTYEYGNKEWNHNRMLGETGGTLGPSGRVLLASQLKRWTQVGEITGTPKLNAENYSIQQTSRFLENGSFLRLRSVSLGYSLPRNAAAALRVQSARLAFQATNLFLVTKYSGADPETNLQQGAPNIQGYDYGIPPMPRSYQLSLRVVL